MLFKAQSRNRIEPRSLLRRIESERNADEPCESTSQHDGPRTDENGPTGIPCDRDSGDGSQYCSCDPPDQRKDQGFDQELPSDVAATGTDRHAQPDFAGPFGHRDQHDVHDADAADDQRNRCHCDQQNPEGPYRSTTCGEHIRWILDPEITGSIAANMMALSEQVLDVAFDFGPVARIGHLDRDEIQGFTGSAMNGTQ